MKRLLKIIILLLILFSFSLFLAIYVKNSDEDNRYDLYLHNKNNLFISIGYYVFKPMLELYIDSRLDNYGLFDGIRSRLFYDRLILKSLIKPGEGLVVQCGDKIKINAIGNKIGEIQQLEYIVGKHDTPIFNIAPIGMKKGEEASIGVPALIAGEVFSDKQIGTFVSFKLEIIDVKKTNLSEVEQEPIIINGRMTNKKAKLCGENASINYSVYDLKGKKIAAEKLNLKIGDSSSLFENFIIGMQPLTKRVVITRGDLINKELQDELKVLVIELVE